MSHPTYKPPLPPVFCTKAKVAKVGAYLRNTIVLQSSCWREQERLTTLARSAEPWCTWPCPVHSVLLRTDTALVQEGSLLPIACCTATQQPEVNQSGVDVQVVFCHCYCVVFHPFVEQLTVFYISERMPYVFTGYSIKNGR